MNKREREKLSVIFDILDGYLGDTDPYIEDGWTDEEIQHEEPLFWVTKEVAKLIQL